MFNKARKEAVQAINVRNHKASPDELEVRPNPDQHICNHQVVDHCLANGSTVIFEGSQPQCKAFLMGMAYGGKAASADFAAAF